MSNFITSSGHGTSVVTPKPPKRILLIVDMLNDFVEDKGSLLVPKAKSIIPFIRNLAEEFIKNKEWITFVCDQHQQYEWNTSQYHPYRLQNPWPKHCIWQTWGAEICDDLKPLLNNERITIFNKKHYGGFTITSGVRRPFLDGVLRRRKIDEIHIVGVCTDICVKSTVEGAYEHNYPTVVYDKGCTTFTPWHDVSLNQMELMYKTTIIR